jgi:hypothetical protein
MVTITARDATAPVVETPWTLFYGPTYQAEARSRDPETGIVSIELHGSIFGDCLSNGTVVGSYSIGGGGLISRGTMGNGLEIDSEGWTRLAPYLPTGCPEGTDNLTFDITLWSVSTNGHGLITRSDTYRSP